MASLERRDLDSGPHLPPDPHPARLFAVALLPAALSVGFFGVLRLARQFPAASSSPNLLVPFLLPVLALALEAGGLIAFTATLLHAFRVVPSRPLATRARVLLPTFAVLGAVLGLAEALPRGTE